MALEGDTSEVMVVALDVIILNTVSSVTNYCSGRGGG